MAAKKHSLVDEIISLRLTESFLRANPFEDRTLPAGHLAILYSPFTQHKYGTGPSLRVDKGRGAKSFRLKLSSEDTEYEDRDDWHGLCGLGVWCVFL